MSRMTKVFTSAVLAALPSIAFAQIESPPDVNQLGFKYSQSAGANIQPASTYNQPASEPVQYQRVAYFPAESNTTGFVFMAESLFLKYSRADGIRVGTAAGEQGSSDFEATGRFTAGLVLGDGVGLRTRWWEYDHVTPALEGGSSQLGVDTYNVDIELFDTVNWGRNWSAELSAGLRYNHFVEEMRDGPETPPNCDRLNRFNGWGGIAAIEVRRQMWDIGNIFVRTRGGYLYGDRTIANNESGNPPVFINSNTAVLELAIGADYKREMSNGTILVARAFYEWQNWLDYSSSFEDPQEDEDFGGSSNVGFNGFGFSVGLIR